MMLSPSLARNLIPIAFKSNHEVSAQITEFMLVEKRGRLDVGATMHFES